MSRSIFFRRIVLSAAAVLAMAPAVAAASGDSKADYPGTGSEPVVVGDSKADYPGTGSEPVVAGDSKADYPGTGPVPRAGDTPADFGDEIAAPETADRGTPWLIPVLAGIILLGTVTGGVRVARQRRRTPVIAG